MDYPAGIHPHLSSFHHQTRAYDFGGSLGGAHCPSAVLYEADLQFRLDPFRRLPLTDPQWYASCAGATAGNGATGNGDAAEEAANSFVDAPAGASLDVRTEYATLSTSPSPLKRTIGAHTEPRGVNSSCFSDRFCGPRMPTASPTAPTRSAGWGGEAAATFQGLPKVPAVKRYKRSYNEEYVKLWSIQHTLEGHRGCINTIHIDDAGQYLLTGSDDCHLCVYDTGFWEQKVRLKTKHNANIFAAVFMQPNQGGTSRVMSCGLDGLVLLTDIPTGSGLSKLRLPSMASSIGVSRHWPDTAYIAYGHGYLARMDCRMDNTRSVAAAIDFPMLSRPCVTSASSVNALAVHERYPHLLAVGTDAPFVFLHDVRMGLMRPFAALGDGSAPRAAPKEGIGGLSFSGRGDSLAVNYRDADVVLMPWAAAFRDAMDSYESVGYVGTDSGDASSEWAVQRHGTVAARLPTSETHSVPLIVCSAPRRLTGRSNSMTMFKEVAFLEDDTVVCTGSDDGQVFFWRTQDGRLIHHTRGDADIVNGVLYHPKVKQLVCCGIDSTCKVIGPEVVAGAPTPAGSNAWERRLGHRPEGRWRREHHGAYVRVGSDGDGEEESEEGERERSLGSNVFVVRDENGGVVLSAARSVSPVDEVSPNERGWQAESAQGMAVAPERSPSTQLLSPASPHRAASNSDAHLSEFIRGALGFLNVAGASRVTPSTSSSSAPSFVSLPDDEEDDSDEEEEELEVFDQEEENDMVYSTPSDPNGVVSEDEATTSTAASSGSDEAGDDGAKLPQRSRTVAARYPCVLHPTAGPGVTTWNLSRATRGPSSIHSRHTLNRRDRERGQAAKTAAAATDTGRPSGIAQAAAALDPAEDLARTRREAPLRRPPERSRVMMYTVRKRLEDLCEDVVMLPRRYCLSAIEDLVAKAEIAESQISRHIQAMSVLFPDDGEPASSESIDFEDDESAADDGEDASEGRDETRFHPSEEHRQPSRDAARGLQRRYSGGAAMHHEEALPSAPRAPDVVRYDVEDTSPESSATTDESAASQTGSEEERRIGRVSDLVTFLAGNAVDSSAPSSFSSDSSDSSSPSTTAAEAAERQTTEGSSPLASRADEADAEPTARDLLWFLGMPGGEGDDNSPSSDTSQNTSDGDEPTTPSRATPPRASSRESSEEEEETEERHPSAEQQRTITFLQRVVANMGDEDDIVSALRAVAETDAAEGIGGPLAAQRRAREQREAGEDAAGGEDGTSSHLSESTYIDDEWGSESLASEGVSREGEEARDRRGGQAAAVRTRCGPQTVVQAMDRLEALVDLVAGKWLWWDETRDTFEPAMLCDEGLTPRYREPFGVHLSRIRAVAHLLTAPLGSGRNGNPLLSGDPHRDAGRQEEVNPSSTTNTTAATSATIADDDDDDEESGVEVWYRREQTWPFGNNDDAMAPAVRRQRERRRERHRRAEQRREARDGPSLPTMRSYVRRFMRNKRRMHHVLSLLFFITWKAEPYCADSHSNAAHTPHLYTVMKLLGCYFAACGAVAQALTLYNLMDTFFEFTSLEEIHWTAAGSSRTGSRVDCQSQQTPSPGTSLKRTRRDEAPHRESRRWASMLASPETERGGARSICKEMIHVAPDTARVSAFPSTKSLPRLFGVIEDKYQLLLSFLLAGQPPQESGQGESLTAQRISRWFDVLASVTDGQLADGESEAAFIDEELRDSTSHGESRSVSELLQRTIVELGQFQVRHARPRLQKAGIDPDAFATVMRERAYCYRHYPHCQRLREACVQRTAALLSGQQQ